MKLNLGCGAMVVDGWVNVDYAIGARLARSFLIGKLLAMLGILRMSWPGEIVIHDLRQGVPYADGSVDVVYSSHFLEHLNREDGRRFLAECRRVLKPGGVLRIVVPDLRAIVARYENAEIPADSFCKELGVLSTDHRDSRIKALLAPFFRFPHQCMYDTKSLISTLQELNISGESRGAFDSAIKEIREIEIESRTHEAVIVEGIKPL